MTEKQDNQFEQVKGNVKETVGNATDHKELEQKCKDDKKSGKVKEAIDNVADKAKDQIDKFTK